MVEVSLTALMCRAVLLTRGERLLVDVAVVAGVVAIHASTKAVGVEDNTQKRTKVVTSNECAAFKPIDHCRFGQEAFLPLVFWNILSRSVSQCS